MLASKPPTFVTYRLVIIIRYLLYIFSMASSLSSPGKKGTTVTITSQPVSVLKSMESKHKPLVILRCKLVLVGDACVGKSALTQVFHSGGSTYPKNYLMTVGAEFCVKQVPIPDTNAVVELYIFDCSGQSIFNHLEMNAKHVRRNNF